MFTINKLRADHVLDFAAEELKKYLRMMMPEGGDPVIAYNPSAKDGFRLGLLEDFGLQSEAADPVLDDVVHIDTTAEGGILAGSNPRSVLFAVYRFFKCNGCRWLYPGIDGEYIPVQDIVPTQYHKMADHRFRGQCNEGAESQQCMLETIDFYAKLEMNVYMIEFDVPFYYYNLYYAHGFNEKNRPPEPVSRQQVLQWKRQCEVEIAKRGLQFHDMGHGWTAEPIGIDSGDGWNAEITDVPPEIEPLLALRDGKRDFYHNIPLNTNLCMSNPKVQQLMIKGIADYAETHQNVSYLHVWLADGSRNHCECDECVKMRPSDFYMQIMNDLDKELTRRNLDTRIVFIAYVDTLYAPEQVFIQNPQRFSLLYAPITRSYTSSITEKSVISPTPEYKRNRWEYPVSTAENMAFLKDWKQNWPGPCFCYEYHFWKHHYRDPGTMYISRRVYEDIQSLKLMGLDGFVEDGSQRAFFPNGLEMYVFAEAMLNRSLDYDAIKKDYFDHIYGDLAPKAEAYLQAVSDTFDYKYMAGERSSDPEKGGYYNPAMYDQLQKVLDLAAEGRALATEYARRPERVQTVSMRLLYLHAEYCELFARFMMESAVGNDEKIGTALQAFLETFGRHEFEIERYFDFGLAYKMIRRMVNQPAVSNIEGE